MKHFLYLLIFSVANCSAYHGKLYVGSDAVAYSNFAARYKFRYFADYPYFMAETESNHCLFIANALQRQHAALVILFHENKPVGFIQGSCALNLLAQKLSYTQAGALYFIQAIIIAPEHRGKGLSRILFAGIEEHARACGYQYCCLCTAQDAHLQSKNYRPLNYEYVGYRESEKRIVDYWLTYQVTGPPKREKHTMDIWIKQLS